MPEPPDELSDEELETWAALATLLEWLPGALDAQLQRDSGLSHFEYGVLFALGRAEEGSLRMSVLAGYANSSLPRLSRAVSRLEGRDWVRRAPDPTDGRFTLAVLTPEGRRRYEQAGPGHVALVRQVVLDPLTAAQRRQLRDITRRVTGALRDEPGWTPPGSGPG